MKICLDTDLLHVSTVPPVSSTQISARCMTYFPVIPTLRIDHSSIFQMEEEFACFIFDVDHAVNQTVNQIQSSLFAGIYCPGRHR